MYGFYFSTLLKRLSEDLKIHFSKDRSGQQTQEKRLNISSHLRNANQAEWVKDLELLQLWHRSKLWFGFVPWPRIFHVPWVQPKKKEKKKKKKAGIKTIYFTSIRKAKIKDKTKQNKNTGMCW